MSELEKTNLTDKVKNYAEDFMDSVKDASHEEGPIAKKIEQQTAKLPSDTFLWLALASIAASATLQLTGNKKTSTFVGQWAPTFLILGLYNKMVKVLGSDPVQVKTKSKR